ncbi:MarR family transcriptional regulator [Rothia sp. HSID18067]|uniref:MarR family winged helix-turn-helix transcriptional regulator n=2 Tax=Micrococcaceae TaxID=1268 RepID=UPI000F8836AC|nr:MarR family winged helix-turn-helix transcriptional regulator [Rothia aeria]RUP72576.1 MarR family transcriptional regulator [Rothia sp. HSID18067]
MTQHNMEGAAMNAQNNTGDNTAQDEQERRNHPCGEPSPTRELYKKLGHIGRLTHLWAAQQRERTGPRRIDTTRGQGRILAALKLKDGIATRELAYVLGIRVPSLNEALSKLENAGYIVREPDPRDRRVQLITLTDLGRALTNQMGEGEPEGDNIFEVLTEQERANLNDYLDRLIVRMHEDLPDLEADRQEWEKAARERMGDDAFEAWAAQAQERGGFGALAGFGPLGGFGPGFGPQGFGPRGFGGPGVGRGRKRRRHGGPKSRGERGEFPKGFEGKHHRRPSPWASWMMW